MRKIKFTLIFCGPLLLIPSWAAGFHMGLGSAVAKQGTIVFEQAALVNNVGDAAAQSLPSCGTSSPYTVSPVAATDIQGIDPLGHVNGYGHTFPADHIYFYIKPADPLIPYGARVVTNVLAPGDMIITSLISAKYNGGSTDYGVEFYACRDLKSYFGHVTTITPELQNKLNNSKQYCTDYGSGGANIHRCQTNVNIEVAAGSLIGTVGGNTSALDFGSYDYRGPALSFISPQRMYGNRVFTVCPVDYFVPSTKATLEPLFGRWDGGHTRTELPLCGETNFDQTGTAFGLWYHIGSPDQPEDPHLALIEDNVYAPRQSISNGTSVPGIQSTFFPFDPLSSGTHNRDFAQVTSDGQVYCYDTFFDPTGNPGGPGFSILISMPTSTTLRVGKYNSLTCGAGPWAFTTYADFQR